MSEQSSIQQYVAKIFKVLLVQSLVGLAVLLALPNSASLNVFVFGWSLQRFSLILVMSAWVSLNVFALIKVDIFAVWISRVFFPDSKQTRVLGFSLLMAGLLGGVLGYLWFAGESLHPLFFRLLPVVSIPLSFAVFVVFRILRHVSSKRRSELIDSLFKVVLVSLAIIGISAMVVYFQIRWQGWEWVETSAVETHTYVMEGIAGSPRQFRVLPEYLVAFTHMVFKSLKIQQALEISLITWRILVNILMLTAAVVYYRKIGLSLFASIVGIGIVGLTLTDAINGSNLAINSYFDVSFYLLAGYVIAARKPAWLIAIVFLAASNRETSGFIPLMLLADYWFDRLKYQNKQRVFAISGISILVYLFVFVGLRLYYPTTYTLVPEGVEMGIDFLNYNISKSATWVQLFNTFGIFPFLAVYAYRSFPRTLKAFAVLLIPAWFGIHFLMSIIAESRLLLVPYVLVMIPGVLLRVTQRYLPNA